MADFDLLKVKVKNRFFSVIEKEHPLITEAASFEISRIKIGLAV